MAKIKLNNIVSASHATGPTSIVGIMSIEININEGEDIPNLDEGKLYPAGADNVGNRQGFPVEGSITLEDMGVMVSLLGLARDDLTIVGNAHGANTDQEIVLANLKFKTAQGSLQRQQDGRLQLRFNCFSEDGDTLPITIGNVA